MKPILIPATLCLLVLQSLQAQEKTNAPVPSSEVKSSTPVPVKGDESVVPGTNGLSGRESDTNRSNGRPEMDHKNPDAVEENTNVMPTGENSMPAASNTLEYRFFKVINDRNIFDATRTDGGAPRARFTPKVTRVDYFKLVGTVRYEKGRYAFFDGNGSDFRGTFQTTQNVADFKVTEISYNGVKLLGTNGTTIDLQVGMQMKRTDDGPWSVASSTETFSSSSSSHESTEKSSDAPSGSNDAENEVMKRLMQKRAKELNK